MKKLLKGLIAIGLCASLAAVPMIVNADPAPLDAAGAEVENANKDATTITVKQTVPRVDYVSNVVYKQINTPNSHQSLVLNMLLPKLKERVWIGQGNRGQKENLGVGNCTASFVHTLPGCPPTEGQMYEFLKDFILKHD